MSQQAATEAMYQQLTADQSAGSLWSALGGRIHHVQAPPNTALPMATLRIADDQPQLYFDGSSDLHLAVEIEVRAADATTLCEVGDLLFDRLHDCGPAVAGFRHARVHAVERGRMKVQHDALSATSRWILTATPR